MAMNDEHAHLVALLAVAIRHGLDSERIDLGPRTERQLIEHVVEHVELDGYTLKARR